MNFSFLIEMKQILPISHVDQQTKELNPKLPKGFLFGFDFDFDLGFGYCWFRSFVIFFFLGSLIYSNYLNFEEIYC